jgi:hypothetical protein
MISCASVKEEYKAVPEGESGNLRCQEQLSPIVPAHSIVLPPLQNIQNGGEGTLCSGDYVVSGGWKLCTMLFWVHCASVVDVKPDLTKDVQQNLGDAAPAVLGEETEFAPTIPKSLWAARTR